MGRLHLNERDDRGRLRFYTAKTLFGVGRWGHSPSSGKPPPHHQRIDYVGNSQDWEEPHQPEGIFLMMWSGTIIATTPSAEAIRIVVTAHPYQSMFGPSAALCAPYPQAVPSKFLGKVMR
jgi:hypothetical protein